MSKVIFQDLRGKKVLITGASSGIGLESVKQFLNQGAICYGQYNSNQKPIFKFKEEHPEKFFSGSFDLSNEEDCVSMVREAKEKMGGIDTLVHSAGIWTDGAIRSIDRDTLEEIFKVNTFFVILSCKRMLQCDEKGINNICWIDGWREGRTLPFPLCGQQRRRSISCLLNCSRTCSEYKS